MEYLNEENKIKGNCLAVGMLGMQFFYMEKDFYSGQFTKTLYPKEDKLPLFNCWVAQYFITILNKFQTVYQGGLVRDFEDTFNKSEFFLPFKNNKVDLSYIQEFITELQAERLQELQAERLQELQGYLQVTGLSNYTLTEEEQRAIDSFSEVDWDEFTFSSLFDSIQQGERLTKSDQISGYLPFVMSGIINTGVVKYIGNSVTQFPKNSITIDIFGNVFYRSIIFGASDDVGVYWNRENEKSKNVMLILAGSIQKALRGRFEYGDKLRSSKSYNLKCHLPTKNNVPDYALMKTLGSAIQKLVIADVVKYADRELSAYQSVIGK